MKAEGTYQAIYAVIRRIPQGRVATYGQVARLAGLPNGARLVGYALRALKGHSEVPWQRVVNAHGKISPRADGRPADKIQRELLEEEGVQFDEYGRLSLEHYGWRPSST